MKLFFRAAIGAAILAFPPLDSAMAAPPPYRLETPAALHAARPVALRFARRSPKVSTTTVESCNRRAERRIDCRVVARGRAATTRTVCHLRIAVRAPDRQPEARLAAFHCGTRSILVLTATRAREVLLARGAEVAGQPVPLIVFKRRARSRFMGLVEWTRSAPRSPIEECFAEMYATISPKSQLYTSLLDTDCEAAPTS